MQIYRDARVWLLVAASGIIGFCFTVASTPKAGGYEINLEHRLGLFWAWTILSVGAAAVGLITARRPSQAALALALGVAANCALVLLPVERGMAFYPRYDAMSHYGAMKDIALLGHIERLNFYPPIHLLGVTVWQATGLDGARLAGVLEIAPYLACVSAWAAIVRLSPRARRQHFAWIPLLPLVFQNFHTVIHPSMVSILLVPTLVLVACLASRGKSLTARGLLAFLPAAAFLVIGHPITAVFMLGVLAAYLLVSTVGRRWLAAVWQPTGALVAILGGLFLVWYLRNVVVLQRVNAVIAYFTQGAQDTLVEHNVDRLTSVQPSVLRVAAILFYQYLPILILGILGSAAGLFLLALLRRRKLSPPEQMPALLLGSGFAVGTALTLFSLVGFTGEYEYGVRVFRFFLLFSPPLISLALIQTLARRPRRARQVKAAVIVGILLAAGVAAQGIYGTPRVVIANWEITGQEISSAYWFVTHSDHGIPARALGGELDRHEQFTLGRVKTYPDPILRDRNPIPERFGWPDQSLTGFPAMSYLVVGESGLVDRFSYPPDLRASVPTYTHDDQAWFSANQRVYRLFDDGELTTFLIR